MPAQDDSGSVTYRQLRDNGYYDNVAKPFTEDANAATLDRFGDPYEEAAVSILTPQEGSALAYMRSIGELAGITLLEDFSRNYAMYAISRNGQGRVHMVEVARRAPRETRTVSLKERLFGPKERQHEG